MTSRRAVLFGGVLACLVAVTMVAFLTPWRPLGGASAVGPVTLADFDDAEVARAGAFRSDLGPWPFVAILVSSLVPWLFLVLADRLDRTARVRRRSALVVATVLGLTDTQWLVTLPMAVHSEVVLRRFGLSTQEWGGWLRDEGTGLGMSAVVTVLGLVGLAWVVRRAPRRWPWVVAAAAALVTVVGSAVYPLVVENAYNDFTALRPSPLTQRIEQLAADNGYGHVRVVVSNASIRTTGENAHVSGLGATRWVVLDDTLLARAEKSPDEVIAVVAHEFGHVVHRDVARGTAIGAAGAVATVLLLAWLSSSRVGGRVFAVRSERRRDLIRSVCLVMAVATTGPYVAAPVVNLVSRRIEASADVHALDTTRNVPAFIRMQHDLATSNLSRLEPTWWQTMLFATHPSPPWRIAQARAWERLHAGDKSGGG